MNEIFKNDRVLLSKHRTQEFWSVISNPSYGTDEKSMSNILLNEFISYVEFENCGSSHRMIKYCDLEKYGIEVNEIKKEHTLTQFPK